MRGAKVSLPKRTSAVVRGQRGVKLIRLTAVSFKRSFRVAPVRLTAAISSVVGKKGHIAPRIKVRIRGKSGGMVGAFSFPIRRKVYERRASRGVQFLLRGIMSRKNKGGTCVRKCRVNKGATASRALPHSTRGCVSSFLKFTPTSSPGILMLIVVEGPSNVCCNNAVTTPITGRVFRGVLPCLRLRRWVPCGHGCARE